jgi:hypothetical protein
MFGQLNAHDALDDVDYFANERLLAKAKWPFLTEFDLRQIKTAKQLTAIVHARSGLSAEEAEADVQSWIAEYTARVSSVDKTPRMH